MPDPSVRMASDYNRGLHPVVRWAHIGAAWVRPITAWFTHPARRHWAVPAALAIVLFLIVHPFDGWLYRLATSVRLGGDARRELQAWQQYGALGSLIFAAAVIWLLDPARRRRLLDLVGASLVALAAYTAMKVLIGRPRPQYGEPGVFLFPFGEYPIVVDGKPVLTHAWEGPAWRTAELWSMPSSHTAAAMVLSVFLVQLYPRLRPLCWVMVAVVAAARLLTGAHWATDVIIGAALGYIAAYPAVSGGWGDRAVEWVWTRVLRRPTGRRAPANARAKNAGTGTLEMEASRAR